MAATAFELHLGLEHCGAKVGSIVTFGKFLYVNSLLTHLLIILNNLGTDWQHGNGLSLLREIMPELKSKRTLHVSQHLGHFGRDRFRSKGEQANLATECFRTLSEQLCRSGVLRSTWDYIYQRVRTKLITFDYWNLYESGEGVLPPYEDCNSTSISFANNFLAARSRQPVVGSNPTSSSELAPKPAEKPTLGKRSRASQGVTPSHDADPSPGSADEPARKKYNKIKGTPIEDGYARGFGVEIENKSTLEIQPREGAILDKPRNIVPHTLPQGLVWIRMNQCPFCFHHATLQQMWQPFEEQHQFSSHDDILKTLCLTAYQVTADIKVGSK